MERQGKVHDKDCGGLYERVVLRPGMFGARRADTAGFDAACWHGEPLAPLLHALVISGSPVCGLGIVPRQARAQLRQLQDLYMRPDPVPEQVLSVISNPPSMESMPLLLPAESSVAPATSAAAAPDAAALHAFATPLGFVNTAEESSMRMQRSQRTTHASQSLREDGNKQITSKKRRRRDINTAADDEHARGAAASSSSPLHSHAYTSRTWRHQRREKKRKTGNQSQKHDSHQGVADEPPPWGLGLQCNGEQAEAAAAADERRDGLVWPWGPQSSSAHKAAWLPRMVGLS